MSSYKVEDISLMKKFFPSNTNYVPSSFRIIPTIKLNHSIVFLLLLSFIKASSAESRFCFGSLDTGSVNELSCINDQAVVLIGLLYQMCGINLYTQKDSECLISRTSSYEFGRGFFGGSVCKLQTWGTMSACDIDVLKKYTKDSFGTVEDIISTVLITIASLLMLGIIGRYAYSRFTSHLKPVPEDSENSSRLSWFFIRLYKHKSLSEVSLNEETCLLKKDTRSYL